MPNSLEPPGLAFSGESRYLTSLCVFANDLELRADIDVNHQRIKDLELGAGRTDSNHQKIHIKIIHALKLLTFREQHVLVQFWAPHVVGKHQTLTTIDQPFGLGVVVERLCTYRQESKRRYIVADKDNEEDDHSPTTRVFRRGLPEWTPDVANYLPKHFKQQECAIRCNLHGYLALPVFYSNSGLCVGVLELLTSSKYMSYAYEVQQLRNALETVELRTQQAFDCPILNVLNERRQRDYDKIYSILKTMCDIHSLPLAQTWAVSQHTSFVSHEKVIRKSCSSFDTRCVGKVCMSRAALPYHVHDLGMWPFLKACRERHLERSRSFVGKALLSQGSCFCEDVTKLSEEEYPLVHNARMNGLTSCLAIFLQSVEANDEYVLEFFLPPDIKDSEHLLNLVETLKQKTEIACGFELGDSSDIQVVGPPTEVGRSSSIDPHTIQILSITTTNNNKVETITSDSESIMVDIANKTEDSVSELNQWQSKQTYPVNITGTINLTGDDFNVNGAKRNNEMVSYPSVSIQKMSNNITDAGEKSNSSKQGRKRKVDSLTMEAVNEHVGKPIDEAAKRLGVSRSTLKRFCRDHGMPRWPLPKHSKKTVHTTDFKSSPKAWTKQNLQWPSNKRFRIAFVVFLMVRVKRWSCSGKRHGFSGKWWSCGKHSYLTYNENSVRNNALHNGDHPAVRESTAKPKFTINNIISYSRVAESSLVHAFPKQTVANVSDIKMVTVKATFKEDMIKFQFPTSSGLLELEHEVARRIKSKSRRPRLKYKDEDNDLILLACDADLHHLLGFTANHSPVKLIVMSDD